VKKWIVAAFDRYVGRRFNVWFNIGLGFLFVAIALFIMPGWARDVWMLSAGANFGYAFMWLTYPSFTKARQREMQAEIDRIVSGAMYRMTREAFGFMTAAEANEENKRTLQ
jgi:hypothetical protein